MDVASIVGLLEKKGPTLPYPYSSNRCENYESNINGNPYCVLHAFDLNRTAILLIGGSKEGDERWYEKFVPISDRLF